MALKSRSDPSLPAVIQRLRRAISREGVFLHQPIALNEDYPAQNPPIVNPRLATRLRKERLQAVQLCFRQPEKIAHDATPLWEFE